MQIPEVHQIIPDGFRKPDADDDVRFEKRLFVELQMEPMLIKMTDGDVSSVQYAVRGCTESVFFKAGSNVYPVNVTGDSLSAIVHDVMGALQKVGW